MTVNDERVSDFFGVAVKAMAIDSKLKKNVKTIVILTHQCPQVSVKGFITSLVHRVSVSAATMRRVEIGLDRISSKGYQTILKNYRLISFHVYKLF